MRDAWHEMDVFLKRQSVRKRRDWMKRLKAIERVLLSVAIVLGGLASLYWLYRIVCMGQTFAVRKIVVEGDLHYTDAQTLAGLLNIQEGDNLFWINMQDVHKRLRENPWVKATTVARRLPNTLWIYIEEHQPKAIAPGNNGLYYVNTDSLLFKKVESIDDKNFPVLTGLEIDEGGEISGKDLKRAKEMLSLIDLIRSSQFGRQLSIAEVNYDRVKGYSTLVHQETAAGTIMQILFGQSSLAERVGQIERAFPPISSRQGRIQYMLANEPRRVIVKYNNSA